MRILHISTIAVCLAAVMGGAALADPGLVAIQGVLKDAQGTPLTGQRVWTLQYYDAETSGNALGPLISGDLMVSESGRWTISFAPPEEVLSLQGQVWYELGIDSAATPDGAVDPEDLFQVRVPVESVHFALQARNSETLDGIAAAEFATDADLGNHMDDQANPHGVSAATVGLGNVDNTADMDKPISSATQSALDTKANDADFTAHAADASNPHGVTAGQVGLGNVDNTADADKPISSATQAALDTKAEASALEAHVTALDNPHGVTAEIIGLGNVPNLKHNLDAAVPPSVTDGAASGFAPGSRWLDQSNGNEYVLLDAAEGAAQWIATTSSATQQDIAELTSHVDDLANPHEVTADQVGLGNVDNTADADKPVSSATQTALDAKADDTDLAEHTGATDNPHTVTAAQVGLGSVDNTADLDKPISAAAQAALDTKADQSALTAHAAAADNPHAVNASQVGLGNVDNTADADKPISNATQTALDAKADQSALTTHAAAMDNPHAVTAGQVGLGNVPNLLNNLNAGAVPQVTDDADAGYAVGSRWIDAVNRAEYVLVDPAAGAAQWVETTAGLTQADLDAKADAADLTAHTNAADNPHTVTATQVGLGNVDNTADANKPISNATQAALDAKADGADVTAHTGATDNPHTVTAAQVGLGNVDNTADVDKPISNATQTALDAKANETDLTTHTAAADNPHTVTATQVGLGNVDNTADADKPISNATQTALNAKANDTDLTAHTTAADNPHTVTAAQVGLGNVDNTADVDKPVSTATQTALNAKVNDADFTTHTNAADNPHNVTAAQVGLGNVNNTADTDKPVSNATQTALNAKADDADLTTHTGATNNPHTVTATQVGLGNVDNTADADKPISTATQTALNAKADDADLTTHTGATSNPHTVTAAQVGLGNVNNTADADKPVSTATQTALNAKANATDLTTHTGASNNPHTVTATQVGLGNVSNLKNNLAATAAPVATDDSNAGYGIGSRWLDTTTDEAYVLIDASAGAAVWKPTTHLDNLSIDNNIVLGLNTNLYNDYYNIILGTEAQAGVSSNGGVFGVGGIAIGKGANARYTRPGSGGNVTSWDSTTALSGVAIGAGADGDYAGIAIGHEADGQYRNIAIGHSASSYSGYGRITIGNDITNRYNGSCLIRGNLFLDGAPERTVGTETGRIFYRDTAPADGDGGGWTAKAFTIDHPLEPETKVLRHYALEGPDVWNVYAGNVQLVDGRAVVELPDYYDSLNATGSEVYSLTAVGGFADLCVMTPSDGRQFEIAGTADVQVSWTVKVLRNDEALLEDLERRPVEQLKSELVPGQAARENLEVNTHQYAAR